MNFSANHIYHIYNQGNNRQTIFYCRQDYITFLTLYKRLFPPFCSTISWCLMPNHFHFMVYTDERCETKIKQGGLSIDPLTNSVRKLLSGYARIFNNEYGKTGSVFRQKTKAKCLSEIKIKNETQHLIQDYYVNCFHYIHQNPLKAKLATKLEEWEFSSFPDYAGLRAEYLCEKELAAKHCRYNADDFIEQSYKLVKDKFISQFT